MAVCAFKLRLLLGVKLIDIQEKNGDKKPITYSTYAWISSFFFNGLSSGRIPTGTVALSSNSHEASAGQALPEWSSVISPKSKFWQQFLRTRGGQTSNCTKKERKKERILKISARER